MAPKPVTARSWPIPVAGREGDPAAGSRVPALQVEGLHAGVGAGVGVLIQMDLVEGGVRAEADVQGDGVGGIVGGGPAGGGAAVGQSVGGECAVRPGVGRTGGDRFAEGEVDCPAPLLRAGGNTVTVLELERLGGEVELRDRPELGPPEEYVEEFD